MRINKLRIFISVLLLFSAIYIFLILQKRVPFGHDTFQYLQLQYIYFNEVVQNHSLPLWFPFTSQGVTGNYFFTPQINILSPVFYLIGLFTKNINYLYLFYFSLWFEELFFLVGIILLSSLYYRDKKTIFFVSITLLGTNIWYPQIWWNFHLYYFIPIVLYCIHNCLQTKLFRYFIFSLIFFSLSVYSNFLYCIVFISFAISAYVLSLITMQLSNVKLFLQKNINFKKIAFLLILISAMALSLFYIKYSAEEIIYLGNTRDISDRTSLSTFLTYGGSIGLNKYIEVIDRHIRSIDINLYAGFLLLPFIIIALLYARGKISLVVGGTALVLFLFSIGTFVSLFFYYLWPLGKIFRHIGLTATIFKLFIVLYAGFGFDVFLERLHSNKKMIFFILIYLLGFVLWFTFKPLIFSPNYFYFVSVKENIILSGVTYLGLLGTVFAFYLLFRNVTKKEYIVNIILLLVIFDLFSYKYALIVTRMPRAPQSTIALFRPYSYVFPEKRLLITGAAIKDNQRMQAFYSAGFLGAEYNTIESFLFIDSAVSSFRTDFLLRSIKQYFNTMQEFPNYNGTYLKYCGIVYPKLSVFSKLNVVKDQETIGKIFRLSDFTGDMLFVSEEDILNKTYNIPFEMIQPQRYNFFKNTNERIPADIWIQKFSFNEFELQINIHDNSQKYYFLYYSDAYHPDWNAYVNGKKTPVVKSNIGYKSILIPGGTSKVMFRFGSIFYVFSIGATLLVNIAILLTIIYFLVRELPRRTKIMVISPVGTT